MIKARNLMPSYIRSFANDVAFLKSTGREFHSLGPLTAKPRSPLVTGHYIETTSWIH